MIKSTRSTTNMTMSSRSADPGWIESSVHEDPELLELQPTINIGAIGHVAHGKSTLVEALTGIKTGKFGSELRRNMTIKLGYANAKIYKCSSPYCPRPECYACAPSTTRGSLMCRRIGCDGEMKLIRHISFVDCPGHEVLMQTMLNGAAVMDGALLVVAADMPCPAPQTVEHLAAIGLMGLDEVLVAQNKIDLVNEQTAVGHYDQIRQFLTSAYGSRQRASRVPIVPMSAIGKHNIDVLCEYLAKIPVPPHNLTTPPRMIIIRSFDVNLPGIDPEDMLGGVAGGSILCGQLTKGQEIEIRPGLVIKEVDPATKKQILRVKPLRTKVHALFSDQNELETRAVPGGLIAVGTGLDPTLTRADRLVGHMLGAAGTLPPVYQRIEISYALIKRAVPTGQSTTTATKPTASARPRKFMRGERIQLNINSRRTIAKVIATKADLMKLELEFPCCIAPDQRISICRKVEESYRLCGIGLFQSGREMKLETF